MSGAEDSRRALGSRRLANAFIVAFLAYQIGMPLTYYLGERGYDERFSWRMFSTVRLQRCEMEVAEASAQAGAGPFRPVSVRADVQAAWVALLERVRRPVVEAYLRRRCERQDARQVAYTRRCTGTDGAALPGQKLVLDCVSGQLSEASH